MRVLLIAGVLGREVKDIPLEQLNVNFEQFCAIVAEFKCYESEAHKLWELVLAKTTRLLQTIVSPLTKILGICTVSWPHPKLKPFTSWCNARWCMVLSCQQRAGISSTHITLRILSHKIP